MEGSSYFGVLLLGGGRIVGRAGCCSLLCSESIKWTVISPRGFHVSFTTQQDKMVVVKEIAVLH